VASGVKWSRKKKCCAGKVEEHKELFLHLSDPSLTFFFSVKIFWLEKKTNKQTETTKRTKKKQQQQQLDGFCASFERHMSPLREQMKVALWVKQTFIILSCPEQCKCRLSTRS